MALATAELEAAFACERGRIRGYLTTLVGPEEAEDLVQEAFARAHRASASHLDAAAIVSWVRRIARNVAIDHLVRGLPERDADVIVLGELRGLKDQEIADALGITLGAAKIRLHRARSRLRRMMERSCDLYRDEDGLACDRRSEGS